MFTIVLVLALAPSVTSAGGLPDETARRRAIEHQRAGEGLMRSEQYEQAVEQFRSAIDLDPLLVIAHYDLGQSYMALKRYTDAVIAYRGCQEAVSRLGSLEGKAREERDRDNQDEIRELRNSIIQIQSGQIKNVAVEAMIPRLEERIRVLEDTRMKGREVVRVPAEVHLGLGSAYFRQNKLAEAEQAYTEAVRTNNRLGAAHNNLAVIYMLSGRLPEARTAMKAAEKSGFRVDPRFKADLEAREAKARK